MTDNADARDTQRQGLRMAAWGTTLLRQWKLCLLIPAGAAIATFLVATFLPKSYRATAVVAVSAINYGVNQMNLRGLPVEGMADFFTEGELLDQTIREFDLQKKMGLHRERFRDSLLQVEGRRRTGTIEVSVTMPQAVLARDVANTLARRGVERYMQQMRDQYETMLAHLENETTDTKKKLTQAEAGLEEFQAKARLEVLRDKVTILRDQRAARERRLLEIKIGVETADSKIQAYTKELKKGKLAEEFQQILADNPILRGAKEVLKQTEENLEKFQQAARLETLRKRLGAQLERKAERAKQREELTIRQTALEQKIQSLRASLAQQKPTVALDLKLARDPESLAILAGVLGKSAEKLGELNLIESVLNPVYVGAGTELVLATAEQKEVTGALAGTEAAEQTGENLLDTVEKQLIQKERMLRELKLEQELANRGVDAAADAVRQSTTVLNPLYVEAAQTIIEAKAQKLAMQTEETFVKDAMAGEKKELDLQEDALFADERQLRELAFKRDKAAEEATQAIHAVREARSVPAWPPERLTIIPATAPVYPFWPRRGIMVLAAAALSVLAVCLIVLYGEASKTRQAERASQQTDTSRAAPATGT